MSEAHRLVKLEREVAGLVKSIHRLEAGTPREQNETPIGKQDHAAQQGQTAPVPELIEGAPSNSKNPKKAASQGPKWWRVLWRELQQFEWKKTLETWGIVFAIGYAVVTFLQWRDLRRNFTASERPYVWLKDVKFQPLVYGQMATANIVLKNFGKSPALNLHTEFMGVYVGENAYKQTSTFFSGIHIIKIVYRQPSAPVLIPSDPQDPNTYLSHPVDSLFIPRNEDMDWAKSHAGGEIVSGVIWYDDMAGNTYYSDFCQIMYLNNAVGPCNAHNEIH